MMEIKRDGLIVTAKDGTRSISVESVEALLLLELRDEINYLNHTMMAILEIIRNR